MQLHTGWKAFHASWSLGSSASPLNCGRLLQRGHDLSFEKAKLVLYIKKGYPGPQSLIYLLNPKSNRNKKVFCILFGGKICHEMK